MEKITSFIQAPSRDWIYRVLPCMEVAFCVDVGAAAGIVTKKLITEVRPSKGVVAFEPFPNNWKFFCETTRGISTCSLRKVALADKPGMETFVVSTTVRGREKHWEEYLGYSSTGHLVSAAPSITGSSFEKVLRSYGKFFVNKYLLRKGATLLKVPVSTLDAEFPDETIDFIKIDVQGAEAKVLRGAKKMFEEKRIRLLYIEWAGELEVIDILQRRGFHLFDSVYLLGSPSRSERYYESMGFEIVGVHSLSTGKPAFELVLRHGDPLEVLNRINRQVGQEWIQTDLIAVSGDEIGRFRRVLDGWCGSD